MLTIDIKINGELIRHIEVRNIGSPKPKENWDKNARIYQVKSGWQEFRIVHVRKIDGVYDLVRQILKGIFWTRKTISVSLRYILTFRKKADLVIF